MTDMEKVIDAERQIGSDAHSETLRRLFEENDWARLALYWFAHQHRPAMRLSLLILNRRHLENQDDGHHYALLALVFHTTMMGGGQSNMPPGPELEGASAIERIAIRFISILPDVQLAETALTRPVESRTALMAKAERAFAEALRLGREAEDEATESMLLSMLASLYLRLGQLDQAQELFVEAIAIRRRLWTRNPEVYASDLALTLMNFGQLQMAKRDAAAGHIALAESVERYRQACDCEPQFQIDLVRALSNLALAQNALGQPVLARQSYAEAASSIERLNEHGRYEADSIRIRMLGAILSGTDDHPALAAVAPKIPNPKDAPEADSFQLETLKVAVRMGTPPDAPEFREALCEMEEHARHEPHLYVPGLASMLVEEGMHRLATGDPKTAKESLLKVVGLLADDQRARAGALSTVLAKCWMGLGLAFDATAEKDPNGLRCAQQAFESALAVLERARSAASSSIARADLHRDLSLLPEMAVAADIKLYRAAGHPEAHDPKLLEHAVEVAESARARALNDRIAANNVRPSNAPDEVVENLRSMLRGLEESERRLTAVGRDRAPDLGATLALERQVLQLRKSHLELVETVRQKYDPDYYPTDPLPTLGFQAIRDELLVGEKTAVVLYFVADKTSFAFVITLQDIVLVDLPDWPAERARHLGALWMESHDEFVCRSSGGALSARGCVARWEDAFDHLLQSVAEFAVHPVVAAIEAMPGRIDSLIICPHRELSLFPLHACRLDRVPYVYGAHPKAIERFNATAEDRRAVTSPVYLVDRYQVSFTPSLSVLALSQAGFEGESLPQPAAPTILLAADPNDNLPLARVEGALLKRTFGEAEALLGSDVTKEALRLAAPGVDLFHYSGHTSHEARQAGLELAGGAYELSEIVCDLLFRRGPITVLSGCGTGLLRSDLVDEYVSLAAAFMVAGSSVVVASWWAIPDLQAALLMKYFYTAIAAGATVSAALRVAESKVRTMTTDRVEGEARELIAMVDDGARRDQLHAELPRFLAPLGERPFESPRFWAPFLAWGASGRGLRTPHRHGRSRIALRGRPPSAGANFDVARALLSKIYPEASARQIDDVAEGQLALERARGIRHLFRALADNDDQATLSTWRKRIEVSKSNMELLNAYDDAIEAEGPRRIDQLRDILATADPIQGPDIGEVVALVRFALGIAHLDRLELPEAVEMLSGGMASDYAARGDATRKILTGAVADLARESYREVLQKAHGTPSRARLDRTNRLLGRIGRDPVRIRRSLTPLIEIALRQRAPMCALVLLFTRQKVAGSDSIAFLSTAEQALALLPASDRAPWVGLLQAAKGHAALARLTAEDCDADQRALRDIIAGDFERAYERLTELLGGSQPDAAVELERRTGSFVCAMHLGRVAEARAQVELGRTLAAKVPDASRRLEFLDAAAEELAEREGGAESDRLRRLATTLLGVESVEEVASLYEESHKLAVEEDRPASRLRSLRDLAGVYGHAGLAYYAQDAIRRAKQLTPQTQCDGDIHEELLTLERQASDPVAAIERAESEIRDEVARASDPGERATILLKQALSRSEAPYVAHHFAFRTREGLAPETHRELLARSYVVSAVTFRAIGRPDQAEIYFDLASDTSDDTELLSSIEELRKQGTATKEEDDS